MRIYLRWAERMGFAVEWIDGQPELHDDHHGDALLRIAGPFAYGMLRGETGVHLLVRLAADGRRWQYFAAVDVLPDGDHPLPPPGELRRDTFRSGGAASQYS